MTIDYGPFSREECSEPGSDSAQMLTAVLGHGVSLRISCVFPPTALELAYRGD
jgi:hypothetical protein